MDFIQGIAGDVCIETVNIERATLREAEEFKRILLKDIEQDGCKYMVIDLSKCEFIDSTFLGAMVVSLKKITAAGGDMKLVGFKPAVHAMLELTRMFRVFETFSTVDEAIDSFRK